MIDTKIFFLKKDTYESLGLVNIMCFEGKTEPYGWDFDIKGDSYFALSLPQNRG